MQNQFQALFAGAFDTFKVFDNLILSQINNTPDNAPKTTWQILNHLIKWQAYQLTQLKNIDQSIHLNEDATWVEEECAASQIELDKATGTFKEQQEQLADALGGLSANDPGIQQKLKIVQELSVHLSFHIGEVILMRRMAGTYPLPHQMKAFLI